MVYLADRIHTIGHIAGWMSVVLELISKMSAVS